MSLQSDIDHLVSRYDSADFDQDADAADGTTVGAVLLKSMRDALERLSDRMCSDCEGNGFVRNTNARYSEEYADGRRTGMFSTSDPEEITCPTCDGVGFARRAAAELPPRQSDLDDH